MALDKTREAERTVLTCKACVRRTLSARGLISSMLDIALFEL